MSNASRLTPQASGRIVLLKALTCHGIQNAWLLASAIPPPAVIEAPCQLPAAGDVAAPVSYYSSPILAIAAPPPRARVG